MQNQHNKKKGDESIGVEYHNEMILVNLFFRI